MPNWVLQALDWIAYTVPMGTVWWIAGGLATIGGAVGFFVLVYQFIWIRPRKHRQEQERAIKQKKRDEQRLELVTLLKKLLTNSTSTSAPTAAQAQEITEAIKSATDSAVAGDNRMSRALALLNEGNTANARELFRAVAEEKSARVDKDSKEAAAAWRHFGAIAGLADPKEARLAYAKAVELEPTNPEGQLWHGYLQLDSGNIKAAEAAFLRLTTLGNQSVTDQHATWSRLCLTDILTAKGKLAEALDSIRNTLIIVKHRVKADPSNAEWLRNLAVSHDKIGIIFFAQGRFDEALDRFNTAKAIAKHIVKADPEYAQWQRDLSVFEIRIGELFLAQGENAKALDSFNEAMAILKKLPDNLQWQRDLSVLYNKIGECLIALGETTKALANVRNAMTISKRLAKADASNDNWQRDLSISHNTMGDVLVSADKLDEALNNFCDAMAIAERLAKSDPGNAGWQRDLAISHGKISSVLAMQNRVAAALKGFADGRRIIDALLQASPEFAVFQKDLALFDRHIADMNARLKRSQSD